MEGATSAPSAGVMIAIQQLDFPLQADLSRAQQALSLAGLSEKEVARWREYGLVAGTLPAQAVQGWMLRLPAWVEGRQVQIMVGEEQVPMSISPPIGRKGLKLAEVAGPGEQVEPREPGESGEPGGPGSAVKWVELTGGRVQFLMRVRRVTEERFLVEVVPHHNQPRVSFEPRLRMERELDGPSFAGLRLLGTLTQGDVLVVMPGRVNEASEVAENEDAKDEGEVGVVKEDAADKEQAISNWGQALLGWQKRNQRLKAVMLMRVVAN